MSDPSLFLFDIDGTILHGSTQVHKDAFAHTYRSVYGLPLSLDGMSPAGRTDRWLLAEPLRAVGVPESRILELMPQAFIEMDAYVEEHLGDLSDRVLPGIREVLAGLKARGQILGLVTGNLRGIAFAKMRQARLAEYFDTGGFGSESEVRSTLVEVALRHAREASGFPLPASRALVIGDTPLDIEGGQACGTRTLGIATGSFSVAELESAGADKAMRTLAPAEEAIETMLALV